MNGFKDQNSQNLVGVALRDDVTLVPEIYFVMLF